MQCEVCGKPIFKTPVVVEIEGTKMRTCEICTKFGTPVKQTKRHNGPGGRVGSMGPAGQAGQVGQAGPMGQTQKQALRKPPVPGFMRRIEPGAIELPEPKEDYNEIIKSAREGRGLTREELGKKINEKTSVITRLESKKMQPDIKLARKLEHALKIKILDERRAEDKIDSPRTTGGGMTLGDMIKVKKNGKRK